MIKKTSPEIPLTEQTFFIMLSLSPGPKHGYAIMKEVETLSDRRVRLSTGTLYGAIKRMLNLGWIHRVEDPIPNETDRERKTYTLTRIGRRMLNSELERLKRLVEVAKNCRVEESS